MYCPVTSFVMSQTWFVCHLTWFVYCPVTWFVMSRDVIYVQCHVTCFVMSRDVICVFLRDRCDFLCHKTWFVMNVTSGVMLRDLICVSLRDRCDLESHLTWFVMSRDLICLYNAAWLWHDLCIVTFVKSLDVICSVSWLHVSRESSWPDILKFKTVQTVYVQFQKNVKLSLLFCCNAALEWKATTVFQWKV